MIFKLWYEAYWSLYIFQSTNLNKSEKIYMNNYTGVRYNKTIIWGQYTFSKTLNLTFNIYTHVKYDTKTNIWNYNEYIF